MINCHITGLCSLCAQLRLYEIVLGERPAYSEGPHDPAAAKLVADFEGWLKIAAQVADSFELDAIHKRIAAIKERFAKRRRLTNFDVATEARVLLETLDADLRGQLIYRYPNEQGRILWKWQEDWAAVLRSFPSAERDIQAAVDLWALGHSTASVFQFMRVLEHGLRALAADVGKTFEIETWQTIIQEIEAEIRQQGKSLPRGLPRNERLQFLSEAAKEFVFFKDGWRNYVSHARGVYDAHQARSVMEHVRDFMTTLSSQLHEV